MDVLYIDDEGKSWAYQSTVNDAVYDLASSQKVQSPVSLAETYRRRYLEDAESLINQLSYQKPFSYDPNNDPVYLAYRNQYLTEGDRASRDSMATYASLTGGQPNSAAATAAAQAELYYNQQLTNQISHLAEQAYQRYQNRYQNTLSLLDRTVDLYHTAYQNAAEANAKQASYANLSASSNVERDKNAHDTGWEDIFRQQTYDSNIQDAEKAGLVMEGLNLDNLQKSMYQQYYEYLLQTELAGKQLNNQLTQAKIYQVYN